MLTFILLVVLGGGLGLLAVSLAESPKPATDGGSQTRAPRPSEHDAESTDEPVDEPVEEPVEEPDERVEAAGVPPTELLDAPVDEDVPELPPEAPVTATVPVATVARRPARRLDPRGVPRAYTAVEGSFDTVAVNPLWRRFASLVALAVIAVGMGVGVAAVAAAVFGALGELLDAAIG